jgi:hypothetical protein
MDKDKAKLIGICGIFCGTCPYFLAPRENDLEQLRKLSQDRGISIEDIRCDGCLSDRIMPHCKECKAGFRKCAQSRKVTWCFQCTEFPCQRLESYIDAHIVDGISHHEHVIEDLQDVKDHGIDQWIRKQEKLGTCGQCGKRLYWFARECPDCHIQVR